MQSLSAQARYATLQQLGVTLWVPRKRLPYAAPSVQCDWPEAAAPLTGKAKLRAAMQPEPPPTPEPPAPAAPPIAPLPVPEAPVQNALPAAAPLTVDVWLLANGWQLVIEREEATAVTQQQLSLLQNLLAALYPGGMGIISQHTFAWPLPGVPVERGDQAELNLSLRAFLTGAQFHQAAVGLLVFGERSSSLLTTDLPALKLAEVYTGPPLPRLLEEPSLKQAFWQEAGGSGLRARFASSPVML